MADQQEQDEMLAALDQEIERSDVAEFSSQMQVLSASLRSRHLQQSVLDEDGRRDAENGIGVANAMIGKLSTEIKHSTAIVELEQTKIQLAEHRIQLLTELKESLERDLARNQVHRPS